VQDTHLVSALPLSVSSVSRHSVDVAAVLNLIARRRREMLFGLRDAGHNESPVFDRVTTTKEVEVSTSAVGQRERDRDDRVRGEYVRRVGIDETKVAFKTTEFLAYLATVAGILIAAAVDETIDARLAWILVAAVGIGYMLSRGLAKSGSNHREGSDTI
jgi:hypothetical protein